MNKKIILTLACLLLLGGAGMVVADTAVGSAQLEAQSFSSSVITAPALVNPTDVVQYDFEVSANLPLGSYGAGLESIHLLWWHNGIIDPMTEPASENNIKLHFDASGWWIEGATLVDHSAPDVIDSILGLTAYQGSASIKYPANSLANLWHHQVVAEMADAELVSSAISDFDVSSYLSAVLLSSSFDFGSIALGSRNMPIQLVDGVAQGYLEIAISCNYFVMVEVGITHFENDEATPDRLVYSSFKQNSVDDPATALGCVEWGSATNPHDPLANLAPVLGDSVIVRIYLWVSPSDSIPDDIYTGILGVLIT